MLCGGSVLGLVTVIAGAYNALGKRVTLFDPTTGATWQQSSLLGIEIERVTMTAMQPLSIDVRWPREPGYKMSLTYPPSITMLRLDAVARWPHEWNEDALFAATLTLLLVRGLLGVGRTGVTRSTFGGRPRECVRGRATGWLRPRKTSKQAVGGEYLIVPGPNAGGAAVDGVLERCIVQVVTEWAKQPAARELPLAPTVFDLVRAIVPDALHPGDRLVLMVQNDAAARELGTIRGGFFTTKRKFIPNPAHSGRLRDEGQVVRALQNALWRSQPDFCRRMYDGIGRGIASRMTDHT
jgi:hypothetical protein